MVWLIVGLIIGFILGLIIMAFGFVNKIVGALRVDSSNEDGPYLFLELNKPVLRATSQKYVVLRVEACNYISQK